MGGSTARVRAVAVLRNSQTIDGKLCPLLQVVLWIVMICREAKVVPPGRSRRSTRRGRTAWWRADQVDCSSAWGSWLRYRRWPPRRPTRTGVRQAPKQLPNIPSAIAKALRASSGVRSSKLRHEDRSEISLTGIPTAARTCCLRGVRRLVVGQFAQHVRHDAAVPDIVDLHSGIEAKRQRDAVARPV